MRAYILIPCGLLMLVAAAVDAAVPSTLAYSGRVLRSSGQPETGLVQLTFSLYSQATGGTAVWSETQSLALSNDGLYQTKLGAVTPLPSDLVAANSGLFLELKVGTNAPLTPRQELNAVPTALVARSVQGGDVDAASLKVAGREVVPGFSVVRAYSSNDTLTLPAGVTHVLVKAWGAGGSGGTTHNPGSSVYPGGGGGAGAYAEDVLTVPAGATLTITVGAAAAVTQCGGGAGGESSVKVAGQTLLVARGGGAGGHAPGCCLGSTTSAGAGGTAQAGVAVPGEDGLTGSNGGDGGKNGFSPVFGRGGDAVLRSATCSPGDAGRNGLVWLSY